MRSTPRHYYEITYDAGKNRYVKRRIHREDCPTCSGVRVPVQRHHEDLGKMVKELQQTVAASREREAAAEKAKADEAKERRERRDKYRLAWIAVLGVILAAVVAGFFGYINKSTPATPTPLPNIYVNQQQSVGPYR